MELVQEPGSATGMISRLGLAIIFAGIIGYNRESQGKAAGFRTMMLVGLGSATFTLLGVNAMLGIYAAEEAAGIEQTIRLDTSRVIAGIVGGIGFLGAGTIIQARGRIEGVTTASSIWVTAAIGVACGLGQFLLALVASGGTVLVLQSRRLFGGDDGGDE